MAQKKYYDPITKTWFGEGYATPEVQERGVEVPAMGVMPGEDYTPPPVVTPPVVPPQVPRYASAESYEEWSAGQPTVGATEEESIRESERRYIQSQIDLIESQYATKIAGEEEAGTERYARTRGMLSAAGLLGTPMGGTAKEETREYTRKQVGLLEEERVTKVNILLDTADRRAMERIEAKRLELKGDWESYQNYLAGIKTEAKENYMAIAQSGVTLEKFKEFTDAEGRSYYDEALEEIGWDSFVFDAMYNLNLPEEQQIAWEYKFHTTPDGKSKVWMFGIDPMTNKPVTKEHELEFEIPGGLETVGMKPTFAPDGTLFLFPDEYDPNEPMEDQIIIYGGRGQFAKPEKETDLTTGEKSDLAIGMIGNYFNSTEYVSDPIRKISVPKPIMGADGYVSPTSWRKAKKAWTDDGLDPEKFIKQFYMYMNPANPQDYGTREMNYTRVIGAEEEW